jgi:hypothetical protein
VTRNTGVQPNPYFFRQWTLGELGRIVLQDTLDGRCQLSCEMVGDPADSLTAERAVIFQPLGLEPLVAPACPVSVGSNEDGARCPSVFIPLLTEDNVYTLADLPQVQASLLGFGGLWHMLKKDLLQNLEMPSHFNKTTCPDLGCAPNLAVMIVAMSGLETMATLANIGGVPAGGAGDDATERVKRFADRYLVRANSKYACPLGQSLIRLLWDAYRNGGLHKFFPKRGTFQIGGQSVTVTFGIGWLETGTGETQRSFSLEEVRALRANDPTLASLRPPHMGAVQDGPNSFQFWICAQLFVLEFVDAVETWMREVGAVTGLDHWFVDGANKFEDGLDLKRHPESVACLTAMITAARAAAAPAVSTSGTGS